MDWIVANAGSIGLIIFFGFFVGMILWLYRPGAKAEFAKNANIPLAEDK